MRKKLQLTFILLVSLLVPLGGYASVGAITASETQPGVYVYKDANYGGGWIRLTKDTPSLRAYGYNDIISSIRVVGNYRATVFQDDNYGGWSGTYDYNVSAPYVGTGFNDNISSIKIATWDQEHQPGVYLYEHTYYQGRWVRIPASTYGTTESLVGYPYYFNDMVSSIRIVGNYRATVFQDVFDNAQTTFGSDCPIIDSSSCREFASARQLGNDQASSIVIFPKTPTRYDYTSLMFGKGFWSTGSASDQSINTLGWYFKGNGVYSYNAMQNVNGVRTLVTQDGYYTLVGNQIRTTGNTQTKTVNGQITVNHVPSGNITYNYSFVDERSIWIQDPYAGWVNYKNNYVFHPFITF